MYVEKEDFRAEVKIIKQDFRILGQEVRGELESAARDYQELFMRIAELDRKIYILCEKLNSEGIEINV